MEFGLAGLERFTFVPTYGGNRDLPMEEQVSVEIVRPTTAQRFALEGITDRKLATWRDQAMAGWIANPEFGDVLLEFSDNVLMVFRMVALHTRNWRNVRYDGRALTDPMEICLRLPVPAATSKEVPLIREVFDAILRSSELSGEELKNFAGQCAGNTSATTRTPTASATAPATTAPNKTPVTTQAARRGSSK